MIPSKRVMLLVGLYFEQEDVKPTMIVNDSSSVLTRALAPRQVRPVDLAGILPEPLAL
jgi:hypothetical protein